MNVSPRVVHCFSIDVEGFAEGMAEAIAVPDGMAGGAAEREEIRVNVAEILEWLDMVRVRATFFTLGRIAQTQPDVVRAIVDAGHELASHGHHHRRLYDMSPWSARESIVRSKKTLEDVTGQPVMGFRAPDFSVSRRSLALLDVIQEAGYLYDSSLCPTNVHDVYGVAGARRDIHRLANGLIEFPPATRSLLGCVVPVLGGGYFRLAPLWLSSALLSRFDAAGTPIMTYTHPYELASRCPYIAGLSWIRRFRHYVNIEKSMERFTTLFARFRFGRASEVLAATDRVPLTVEPLHAA